MKYVSFVVLILTTTFSFAQTAVDTAEEVSIGGIKQFITLEGKDENLPLLLFLHGGPGRSVMSYADRFTDKLKEHFIVVQWDQRETGRTLALNASPVPLSLSVFQNDTYELIQLLLRKFHREKLYLAGHSWGTALGFYIARTHPGLLYAYLPIGPMINQLESERLALALMQEHALKKGNQKEAQELATIHVPFENGEQLYFHRKWLQDLSGSRKQLQKTYVENWASTWLAVFNDASKENLFETLPAISCPVYFFAGKKDLQTNSSITDKYYTFVTAPQKKLFWFDAGHSIPSAQPQRLQEVIIDDILPETFTIQKAAAPVSNH
jgi:pimeloyl-ACP methyl ester carboxylesterase